jgi:hypothetical protein
MLIDWFTVGAQALNFLILVWLMKRFLYKPILNAVAEREKRIAAELADAAQKKDDAENRPGSGCRAAETSGGGGQGRRGFELETTGKPEK